MDSKDVNGCIMDKHKPVVASSLRSEKVEDHVNGDDDSDSNSLLPPRRGGMSRNSDKTRRSVQWNDRNGNKLAEVLEYEPRSIGSAEGHITVDRHLLLFCPHKYDFKSVTNHPSSPMGLQSRRDSYSGPLLSTAQHRKDYSYSCCHRCHHSNPDQRAFEYAGKDETNDLIMPFQKLERLNQDDIRECAYEIFFTACRSSPGFGSRQVHSFYLNNQENEVKSPNVVMSPTSKYVVTGQIEPDLLCATNAMLSEVAIDAKREKESLYVKLLTSVLSTILGWAEKRLVNYHEYFQRGNIGQIENILPVVLSVSQILGEDLSIFDDGEGGKKGDITIVDSSGDRVDYYIRSTIKHAFEKVIDAVNAKAIELEIKGDFREILLHLAQETEELAIKERVNFTPMLQKWHPAAGAVAAMMLHSCYGHVLRQYLGEVTSLTRETVEVLQRAEKVEKVLLQMVVDECGEDNAKTVMREMAPYEVDSIIMNLLRKWINESLSSGKDCLQRAKETETWNPKSKSEPYAPSVAELVNCAKTVVEQFFKIPMGITEDIVQELADGLESLFQDYVIFVAACGTKQSYIPSLPPLTRCNRDSKFIKLLKKATPCGANYSETDHISEGHHPRPSTSRGTQRLYVRLNTLHYLLSHINTIEKSLSQTPGVIPSPNRKRSGPYFEITNSSIPAACQHVSEVAAYRLIFLDSNSAFYGGLYLGDVANARIQPALRILKQNITLMTTLVTDRAQALAMRELMKASFDAFLMVLLAGGSSRVFNRSDSVMIQEDFESLNRVFCSCGEGLIAENLVEREAAAVQGVIALMGQNTEQLMDDFSIATCETSGIGVMGTGQKLPMPPTTGRWNRSDPNTILRVLCHRNDRSANLFLKRTFQLAKRR
ncbi:uncharacterized protein HKW66_Vig0188870 [Vigna angularis]|uniref:MHD1 domain-containing protein n=1 Tax=Phaseolus angularis TaxID=3914 RepID=A0A8T0KTP6_PHAAN|nr:uncharacterized protein HKW66_Vig0188870 [Vigna angularis]